MSRELLKRLALATGSLLLSALVVAAGFEIYARWAQLDLRRTQAIAVSSGMLSAQPYRPAPEDWGVSYLPRTFSLDEAGFETAWGRCEFDSSLPTVLLLGDSTTRQTTNSGYVADEPKTVQATWARRVVAALEGRYQVCVIAEDGYHPTDYAHLAEQVTARVDLELIVVLLCNNDISDQPPVLLLPTDKGGAALYHRPMTAPIYPPLWQPWLYDRSEGFRFLHWRLAEATGNRIDQPLELDVMRWDQALERVEGYAPTQLFFLPHLNDSDSYPIWIDGIALRDLAAAGIDFVPVDLEAPWKRWRRKPDDRVHLSDAAHQVVADTVLPRILEALD